MGTIGGKWGQSTKGTRPRSACVGLSAVQFQFAGRETNQHDARDTIPNPRRIWVISLYLARLTGRVLLINCLRPDK